MQSHHALETIYHKQTLKACTTRSNKLFINFNWYSKNNIFFDRFFFLDVFSRSLFLISRPNIEMWMNFSSILMLIYAFLMAFLPIMYAKINRSFQNVLVISTFVVDIYSKMIWNRNIPLIPNFSRNSFHYLDYHLDMKTSFVFYRFRLFTQESCHIQISRFPLFYITISIKLLLTVNRAHLIQIGYFRMKFARVGHQRPWSNWRPKQTQNKNVNTHNSVTVTGLKKVR